MRNFQRLNSLKRDDEELLMNNQPIICLESKDFELHKVKKGVSAIFTKDYEPLLNILTDLER